MQQAVNLYLDGNFAPIDRESDLPCSSSDTEGAVPKDLVGYLLRNGPNNQFAPVDPKLYHPFDGDGMIHLVEFRNGTTRYRNRWVRTEGFALERKEGKSLWPGFNSIGKVQSPPGLPMMKNLANTALVWHGGRLLATWEAGSPYEVALPSLETVGEMTFGGGWTEAVTAHPKVDPRTGEMMIFCYSLGAQPYVRYGVIDSTACVRHRTGIELAGAPVMIHDTAITQRYSLILDMPITFSLERVMNGGPAFGWEPGNGARIGVLPRYGQGSEVRWFDVAAGYIFHTFNAWEEGDDVVLDACRASQPSIALEQGISADEQRGRLYRYRMNLTTGKATEERIDETPLEFSRINEAYMGVKTRYGYASRFHPMRGFLFDAVIKHDRHGDRLDVLELGEGRYTQEFVFAPRIASRGEDDGYVIGLVHDESSETTECWVIDAARFGDGPIARVRMPQRVPYGFHSHWVAG